MENSTVTSLLAPALFTWYDYVLLVGMLSISGGFGIFFGCCKDKETNAKVFLMGGSNLKVVPVAISMVASHASGVTLLSVPADVYAFGATYILAGISIMIVAVLIVFTFIPVFHELQLMSTYKYLGLRFDERTRKCSSFLFALAHCLYSPILIYVPGLALSAATGIDVHILTPIICGLCIFYTSLGGLKALVWIDTLQFTATFGILTFLLGLGINGLGGISNLWNADPVKKRMDIFNFSLDPTEKDTATTFLVGFTTYWLAHTSDQGCVQKFLSVPTLRKSQMVIILYTLGITTVKMISVLFGMVLSAKYAGCDPFVTHQIQRSDQLLPYYVLNVAKNIPGLSGFFIAGVLSASLSTFSGCLNSVSGTIYEDFLRRPLARNGIKNDGMVLKILVVIIGVITTLMVYVVENMGGIFPIAIGVGSVGHGPLLGMFILGMFFPRANSKGAFYGALTAISSMLILITGGNVYKLMKKLRYAHKPISVDQCDFFVNTTVTSKLINETMTAEGSDIFPFFRISTYWYTFLGTMICMTSGLIISYLTEKNDPPVPKKFLSPVIHPFLSKDRREDETVYSSLEEAIKQLSIENGEGECKEKITESIKHV